MLPLLWASIHYGRKGSIVEDSVSAGTTIEQGAGWDVQGGSGEERSRDNGGRTLLGDAKLRGMTTGDSMSVVRPFLQRLQFFLIFTEHSLEGVIIACQFPGTNNLFQPRDGFSQPCRPYNIIIVHNLLLQIATRHCTQHHHFGENQTMSRRPSTTSGGKWICESRPRSRYNQGDRTGSHRSQ